MDVRKIPYSVLATWRHTDKNVRLSELLTSSNVNDGLTLVEIYPTGGQFDQFDVIRPEL